MAEKDLTEKILEDYPDVFADIFNTLIFNGKQAIKDSELSESIVHSQYKADDSKIHELERDSAKRWIRNNILLAILGTENQSRPEKLMVSRVIGYDEVLKLLSAFTGNSRYEEVIQCENYEEVDSMCEIMDRAVNKGKALGIVLGKKEGRIEGQNQLFTLWNWLTASGRSDEAAEIMNPSNEVLRKTLYMEYENSVQKE